MFCNFAFSVKAITAYLNWFYYNYPFVCKTEQLLHVVEPGALIHVEKNNMKTKINNNNKKTHNILTEILRNMIATSYTIQELKDLNTGGLYHVIICNT